ncbi:MAG TPA: polysaccharide biosynthesis/export family protein [Syntrophales bacterium]|jgi:polysaccharide export outer membrane protein|nr:polysaccharide biosynthesis/export family protein [Syntrophales bacterium]
MNWKVLSIVLLAACAAAPGYGGTPAAESGSDVYDPSVSYVIGPEDVLFVHVWKEEDVSRTVTVRSDGKISLPIIDEVQAAGKTPVQLKEDLIRKFRGYIGNPSVAVIVNEANSFRVFVSGQVRNPGMYRLRSDTTLLQMIPAAGGFTDWADQKNIVLIRKEKDRDRRIEINFKKIVEGERKQSEIRLRPGDTIIVP